MKKIKCLGKEIMALAAIWTIAGFKFDLLTVVVSLIIIGYSIYHVTGGVKDER